MKKYSPIVIASIFLTLLALGVVYLKNKLPVEEEKKPYNIGNFVKENGCARHPNFLKKLNIPQPVAIDLSQQNYKGLAFLYGEKLKKALHLKTWGKFDHFSTYALDPKGNLYLSPMPFISIKEKTFEFQQNIYKLETDSGKLSVWMSLDEVVADQCNPYGIIALVYDCDDQTLWVSAIDESDYVTQKGVIYQIDIEKKMLLQRIEGVDALSLQLLKTSNGKYLLYGSAREGGLFALKIQEKLPQSSIKLVDLPVANEYIRKIRVKKQNIIQIETIPFSYSLVAATSTQIRNRYQLFWDSRKEVWVFK